MALLPWHDEFWYLTRPSRIVDQQFGLSLNNEDMWSPFVIPRETRPPLNWPDYYRLWRSAASKHDTGSTVKLDTEQFQVNLDVQQFTPNEIIIKTMGDNKIVVEGKHEEREDEHGFIFRHFIRRYILPNDMDIMQVESKLSSDGVLTITAPKIVINNESRNIPITQTGQPSSFKNNGNLEKGDT